MEAGLVPVAQLLACCLNTCSRWNNGVYCSAISIISDRVEYVKEDSTLGPESTDSASDENAYF